MYTRGLVLLQSLIKEISVPKESINCFQCKMVQKEIYSEKLKCCTYHPFLANFAVGAILDKSNAGSEVVLNKIKNREFEADL